MKTILSAESAILILASMFTPKSLAQPGSLDITFNPGSGLSGVANVVNVIAIQTNGEILVGGWLYSINGVTRNRIGRMNSDGSLDGSFDPGDGPDGPVQALAMQGDGKFVIEGQFFSMNGLLRRCLARLRADGSLDTGFDPGLGIDGIASQSSGPYLAAIVLQPDGQIGRA